MNQKALTTQQQTPSRFALLEGLENGIMAAFRRGLNATISMGNDFDQIREKELYRERGYESFGKYVEEHFGMSRQTAERMIGISRTAQLIQDAGLVLPANENQIAELTKLEPEELKVVWKSVLGLREAEITTKNIRKAIEIWERKRAEQQEQEQEEEQKSTRSGVKTALDSKDNGDQDTDDSDEQSAPKPSATKAVVPDRIRLSQEGEAALDRIRELCGKETAEGIEKCYVSISERDLIKWADESDVQVKNLAHYIVDLRWSVRKALEYEDKIIDGETTLDQLIVLARAHGGHAVFEHPDYNELYKITVERTKILQQ